MNRTEGGSNGGHRTSVPRSRVGWAVTSTNKEKANYPCIDLIDAGRKLGIQVTAEKDSDKVNDTLTCLDTNKMSNRVAHLKVLLIVPKQKKYTINVTCPGVHFDWETDIMDFDDVLVAAQAITDLQHLSRVQKCVVNAMPTIYPQYSAPRTTYSIRTHQGTKVNVPIGNCDWYGPASKPIWLESDPKRMSDDFLVAKFTSGADLSLYQAPKWGIGTWMVIEQRTGEGTVINCDQLRELWPTSATTTTTTTTLPPAQPDEDAKAWWAEYRRQLGNNLQATRDRIEKEMSNFEKIVEKRETVGLHRKAVEVYSFELVAKELTKLKDVDGYRELVAPLLAEIERIQAMPSGEKEVDTFLELLKPLQTKLEVDVQGYPPRK